MQLKQRTTMDLLTKVNSFIDSKPAVLANSPDGYDDQVTAFKTAFGIIQQATADQGTGTTSQATAQRQAARQELRLGHLHPMRKIARVLERSVAGMPQLVTVPRKSASTQALLQAARGTAQDVAPYEAQFISKGMPADFLGRLNQSIQTLQDTDAANAAAKQLVQRAQGQLATAIQEAKDAVTCLDVIVRRACAADPANGNGTLNVWNGIVPPPAKLTVLGSATPSTSAGTSASTTASTAPSTAPSTPAATGSGTGSGTSATAAPVGGASNAGGPTA